MSPRVEATWRVPLLVLAAVAVGVAAGYLGVQAVLLPSTLAEARLHVVPDLAGMELDDAVARGEDEGYRVVEAGRSNADVERGRIVFQIPPPGFHLPRGDTLRVLVSAGPDRPRMPDLAGLDPALATSILHRLGLEATAPRTATSDLQPAGVVIATVPPAGSSVARETRVTLVVSRGGSMLAMPDVRGLTLAAARDSLERVGLSVGEVVGLRSAGPGEREVVVGVQEPGPGARVRSGSAVRLRLGEAAPVRRAPPRVVAPEPAVPAEDETF